MANFRLYYDSQVLKMKVGVNVILPNCCKGSNLSRQCKGFRKNF